MSDDKAPEEEKDTASEADKKPEKKEPSVPSLDDLPPLPGEEEKKADAPKVPPLPDAEGEAKKEKKKPRVPPLPDVKADEVEEPKPIETAPPLEESARPQDAPNFGDLEEAMSAKSEDGDDDEEGESEKGGSTALPDGPGDQDINYVSSDVTNLQIGDDIGLTNKDPTLKRIIVGAGWEVRSFEGEDPDLDLTCFVYNKDRQTRKDEDFIFYNNRESEEGEVRHMGDSRTGAGEGDDESISIDLQAFPFDVAGMMFAISIHEGEENEQDFSLMKDVFIRVMNADTHQELCKLQIPDDFMQQEKGYAMKVGRVFRDGPKWRFHGGVEVIKKGGLRTIATEYGILVM